MDKVVKILSSVKQQPIENTALLEKFRFLATHMAEENKKVNITSILDPVGIATKHFADSLSLLRLPELSGEGLKIADIGCGGGFPGLPVAMARPDLKLLMLDSTEKKIRYVDATSKLLGLENVTCISGRAEDLSSVSGEHREKYDVAVSRAVARLCVLSEICLSFVSVGGYFVAMKAVAADEELSEAEAGFAKLGGRLVRCEKIPFSFENLDMQDFSLEEKEQLEQFSSCSRALIVVKKVKPTPREYPRAWARITKKPL